MASELTINALYLLCTKAIDFSGDTFKIILMQSGFTFDEDAHELYADVVASELSTGNGYTQGTKALAGVTVTKDETDERIEITWSNVTWTASGGSIGPTPGAIIYDDTVVDDPIIGYLDFGGDQTQADGGTATISNIEFRLAAA